MKITKMRDGTTNAIEFVYHGTEFIAFIEDQQTRVTVYAGLLPEDERYRVNTFITTFSYDHVMTYDMMDAVFRRSPAKRLGRYMTKDLDRHIKETAEKSGKHRALLEALISAIEKAEDKS